MPPEVGGVRIPRSRTGFTILEVLIALVVLVIGILGIFALVPTAVRSAASTVDELHASQQARSIVEALRLGARDLSHEVWRDTGTGRELVHAFFWFPHPAALPAGQPPPPVLLADGTVDPAVFDHPACILLPHGVDRTFVYPRAAAPGGAGVAVENGRGDARAARDDLAPGPGEPLVRRVYGGAGFAPDGTPLPGYSFALMLSRARVDGASTDGLYRVSVLLYHGFTPYDPAAPTEEKKPIAVYTTELIVGPTAARSGS